MSVAPPVEHQVPSMPASVLAALLDAVGPANPMSPRPRWGEAPDALDPRTQVQLQVHGLIDEDGRPRPAFADIARVILEPHSVIDLRFWHESGSWALRGVLAEDAGVAINETGDEVIISGPVTPTRIGELVAGFLPGTALELDPGVELDTHLSTTDALVLAAVIEAQRASPDAAAAWLPVAELRAMVDADAASMRADDLRLITRVIGGVAVPPDAASIDTAIERLVSTEVIERDERGIAASPSLIAIAAFLGAQAPGWRWQRATQHEPASSTWTDQIVLIGAGGLQVRVVAGSPGHVVIQTVRPRDLAEMMAAELALLHRPPGLDTTNMPDAPPRTVAAMPIEPPTASSRVQPPPAATTETAPPPPATTAPAPPPEPARRRGRLIVGLIVLLLLAAAAGAGAMLLLNDDDTADPVPTTTLAPTTVAETTTTAVTTTSTTTTTTTTTTTIPLIVVPSLVGLDVADAEAALLDLGLVVEVIESETGAEAPGTVLATDPPDTSELEAGDTVVLTVAVEPPPDCNDIPDPLPPSDATDIDGLNAEGRDAIAWSQAVGLIGGGDARPDDPMSRAATATVVWRYFCEPPADAPAGFTDVEPDAFYADAADWAAGAGLINGVDATTFDPEGAVTRAQFVTIAWRATGSPLPLGPAPFTDTDPDGFYADALDWAFTTGLVGGVTPTTFEPDRALDRRTTLILMYRLEVLIDPQVD